jgi:hypothetical protein
MDINSPRRVVTWNPLLSGVLLRELLLNTSLGMVFRQTWRRAQNPGPEPVFHRSERSSTSPEMRDTCRDVEIHKRARQNPPGPGPHHPREAPVAAHDFRVRWEPPASVAASVTCRVFGTAAQLLRGRARGDRRAIPGRHGGSGSSHAQRVLRPEPNVVQAAKLKRPCTVR